jgi:hypothetical protein
LALPFIDSLGRTISEYCDILALEVLLQSRASYRRILVMA